MQALCSYSEGMCPAWRPLSSQCSPLQTGQIPWALCNTIFFLFPVWRKKLTWNKCTWFMGFRIGLLAPQSKCGPIYENHSILVMVSTPLILQIEHWNPAKENACWRPTWVSNRAELELSSRFPSQYLHPKPKGQSSGQCFLSRSRPELLISLFILDVWNANFNSRPVLCGPFANALSLGSAWTQHT